jgi:hypothetical protein
MQYTFLPINPYVLQVTQHSLNLYNDRGMKRLRDSGNQLLGRLLGVSPTFILVAAAGTTCKANSHTSLGNTQDTNRTFKLTQTHPPMHLHI